MAQFEYFSESPQGVVYREISAPWIGVAFALLSLLFLAVTVAFLKEVMGWPWHSGKVAGLFTALVFTGASFFVGLLAFASFQPQHLCFDAPTRQVYGRARGAYWPLKTIHAGFESFQQPVVRSKEREMDSDFYEVHIEWPGHLILTLGEYERRPDAEFWRGRLERLLKT